MDRAENLTAPAKTSQPTPPSAAPRPTQPYEASPPKRICPEVPPSDGLGVTDAAADSVKIDTLTNPTMAPRLTLTTMPQLHWPKA